MDENQETQHFDDGALKFGFFLVLVNPSNLALN